MIGGTELKVGIGDMKDHNLCFGFLYRDNLL